MTILHMSWEIKQPSLISSQKHLLVQGQSSNLLRGRRSLLPPDLSTLLELSGGYGPGSITCSCLSFLQLVLGFLLFKVAFGKHFLDYFVTYAISL